MVAATVTGVGALVLQFASVYLADHPAPGRFYLYLLSFMGSMLGIVLSENLLLLFIFWELTSVTSFALIGYDHHRSESREAALRALLLTGAGGLALLAGIALLLGAAGTLSLDELRAAGGLDREHALYPAIVVLFLLGAFTKSAQFPFHFWLPGAMEAPSPVSAYLHSATMVKAGVFLLAIMSPILGGTPSVEHTLLTVGMTTMLVGRRHGLCPDDMKRMLAYTTVSVLGVLVALIGLGTPDAFLALPSSGSLMSSTRRRSSC
jgi:multicomponent Na+:H+ antiporter subunit A